MIYAIIEVVNEIPVMSKFSPLDFFIFNFSSESILPLDSVVTDQQVPDLIPGSAVGSFSTLKKCFNQWSIFEINYLLLDNVLRDVLKCISL